MKNAICIVCNEDKVILAKEMCDQCYGRNKRGASGPVVHCGWSRYYSKCTECGTTEKRHKASGLCIVCNGRKRTRNKIKPEIKVGNCEVCSSEFKIKPNIKNHRFCSRKCCDAMKKAKNKEKALLSVRPVVNKKCAMCDKNFIAKSKSANRVLYCSGACRSLHGKRLAVKRRAGGIPKKGKSDKWKQAVMVDETHALKSEYIRYFKDNERKRDGKIECGLSEEEFITLVKSNCFYCDAKPAIKMHVGDNFLRNGIDRLDHKQDYIWHNCVPCCWPCNQLKGRFDLEEFLDRVRLIARMTKTYSLHTDDISLSDRVQNYNNTFQDYPQLIYSKGWILGSWSIGACYSSSGYHGAYPYKYLARIRSLFTEFPKDDVLHLFSGSLSPGFLSSKDWCSDFPGITLDINPKLNPDVCGDAEKLSQFFPEKKFGIIVADCPYSGEDADNYGYPMINRNKVLAECFNVLKPGGFVVWLDCVLPMYTKKQFKQVGGIGVSISTNHRARGVFIFQRQ